MLAWLAGVPPTIVEGSLTIGTAMLHTPKVDNLYLAAVLLGHFNLRPTDVEYDALDGLVGYTVRRVRLHAYEDFMCSLQTWDITPSRFSTMTVITHNPNPKLTELASTLGVVRFGVVLLVDTLEDTGMVEHQPSPKDKRAFRLVLITKGTTTLDEIICVVTAHDARVTAYPSADERQTLLALFNKLVLGSNSAP